MLIFCSSILFLSSDTFNYKLSKKGPFPEVLRRVDMANKPYGTSLMIVIQIGLLINLITSLNLFIFLLPCLMANFSRKKCWEKCFCIYVFFVQISFKINWSHWQIIFAGVMNNKMLIYLYHLRVTMYIYMIINSWYHGQVSIIWSVLQIFFWPQDFCRIHNTNLFCNKSEWFSLTYKNWKFLLK